MFDIFNCMIDYMTLTYIQRGGQPLLSHLPPVLQPPLPLTEVTSRRPKDLKMLFFYYPSTHFLKCFTLWKPDIKDKDIKKMHS